MNAPGSAGSPPRLPRSRRPREVGGVVLVLAVVAAALAATAVAIVVAPSPVCECPEAEVAWVATTPASVVSTPAGYEYAFTITQVIAPPEVFGDFSFWFTNALGTNVPPGPGWTVTVNSSAGNFTAGILPTSQLLNIDGAVPVTVGAMVTVFTAHLPLAGGRILLDSTGDGDAEGLSTVVIA